MTAMDSDFGLRFLGQSNSVYARDVDEQNDQEGYKEGIRKSVHGES